MIILVYSFSLFVSSKTRYHAEFKYIESSLLGKPISIWNGSAVLHR